MYGISADELHKLIIDDLRDYCEHWGIAVPEHIFGNEQGRPIEQTIRMLLSVARDE